MSRPTPLTFLEFFAGGGMARAGLGEGWRCLFANDIDPGKANAYRENWGGEDFNEGDVWALRTESAPGRADLAWASSPCQDLSLAGRRKGLAGGRSSAFWGFWSLIQALDAEGRAPRVVVLENVAGLLSSNGGADFTAVCEAFAGLGYAFGAVELDAAAFLPQSRARVFVVATRNDQAAATAPEPGPFHSRAVQAAFERLPPRLGARWRWWRLPAPPGFNARLADLLLPDEQTPWRSEAQTLALLAQLSPPHRLRFDQARSKGRVVAAVYRRIRMEGGIKVQRAELRLDGFAGCLRTPAGGSSRQLLLIADGDRVRSRHLTAREGARLMGLPDSYRLPRRETAGLRLLGDGLAAPVVRFLAAGLIEPLLAVEAFAAAE